MLLYAGASANDPPLHFSLSTIDAVRCNGGPWQELLTLLLTQAPHLLNLRAPVSHFETFLRHAKSNKLDAEYLLFLVVHGADLALQTKEAERALAQALSLAPEWRPEEVRELARRRWLRKID